MLYDRKISLTARSGFSAGVAGNKILLLHVWPPCSYPVDPGLHHLAQNMDVAFGVQPEALMEEVQWQDVPFTADGTENYDSC